MYCLERVWAWQTSGVQLRSALDSGASLSPWGGSSRGKVQLGSRTDKWHLLSTWHENRGWHPRTEHHLSLLSHPRLWGVQKGKGRKEKCWLPFGRSKGPAEGWIQKKCFFWTGGTPWWWIPEFEGLRFLIQEVTDAGQSCWKQRSAPVAEARPGSATQRGVTREWSESGWTFNNKALPVLLGNREDICNLLWIPCGLGTECLMAVQLSRGCTRDCQLGRMCVHDVDVRRESGTEEGGCCLSVMGTPAVTWREGCGSPSSGIQPGAWSDRKVGH